MIAHCDDEVCSVPQASSISGDVLRVRQLASGTSVCVRIVINGKEVEAVVDTGAERSLIPRHRLDALGVAFRPRYEVHLELSGCYFVPGRAIDPVEFQLGPLTLKEEWVISKKRPGLILVFGLVLVSEVFASCFGSLCCRVNAPLRSISVNGNDMLTST